MSPHSHSAPFQVPPSRLFILSLSLPFVPSPRSQDGHRETQLDSPPPHSRQEWAFDNVRSVSKCWRPATVKRYHRTQKKADDVVITLAIRTPLTKGFKGGMKDTPLDFLVYSLLKKVLEKSNIDPQLVEDVCLGNVRPLPWMRLEFALNKARSATARPPTSSAPPHSQRATPPPPPPPP